MEPTTTTQAAEKRKLPDIESEKNRNVKRTKVMIPFVSQDTTPTDTMFVSHDRIINTHVTQAGNVPVNERDRV